MAVRSTQWVDGAVMREIDEGLDPALEVRLALARSGREIVRKPQAVRGWLRCGWASC
jgi:hypothetical protein